MKDYKYLNKNKMIRINIKSLNIGTPDLKNNEESKSLIISKWMIDWMDKGGNNIYQIDTYHSNNTITSGMLMPTKEDFAYYLGVSIGTIQNAFRHLEDMGYVESKQRIGTVIRDKSSNDLGIRKLTSKREHAIAQIKKFISSNKMKKGSVLPSSRAMATLIGCSTNTTRMALEYLKTKNILKDQKQILIMYGK